MESSDSEDLEEGCSSSESGWTMYIASPIHENETHNEGEDDKEDESSNRQEQDDKVGYGGNRKDDEASDDSMASDASSGPSHQTILRDFKNAKGSHHQPKSSGKNPNKQVEKHKRNRKTKTEKDEHYLARNGGKARKPR